MNDIAALLPIYKDDSLACFKEAYDSLQLQSVKGVSIILLVDGELDALFNSFISTIIESNTVVLRFEKNRGLAAVLNDGLKYCFKNGYEFIARMDADDISLPDRFEKQINYLIENPDIDIVGGAIEEIDEKGNSRNKIIRYPLDHLDCYNFFAKRDPLAHPAVMFRKRYFEKAGFYNELFRKNQDTQLWFAGFKNGCKFANLEDTILKFRVNDGFFKNRRAGLTRAKKMFKDRLLINKELKYGFKGNLFAFSMFLITVSPSFVRKLAYKILR